MTLHPPKTILPWGLKPDTSPNMVTSLLYLQPPQSFSTPGCWLRLKPHRNIPKSLPSLSHQSSHCGSDLSIPTASSKLVSSRLPNAIAASPFQRTPVGSHLCPCSFQSHWLSNGNLTMTRSSLSLSMVVILLQHLASPRRCPSLPRGVGVGGWGVLGCQPFSVQTGTVLGKTRTSWSPYSQAVISTRAGIIWGLFMTLAPLIPSATAVFAELERECRYSPLLVQQVYMPSRCPSTIFAGKKLFTLLCWISWNLTSRPGF